MSKKEESIQTATPISQQALSTVKPPHEISVFHNGVRLVAKKAVTRPFLAQTENQTVWIRIESPFAQETDVEGKAKRTNDNKEAPYTAIVTNLQDGVQYDWIAGAVALNAFKKTYPNDSYVGHMFSVRIYREFNDAGKMKKYNSAEIIELGQED